MHYKARFLVLPVLLLFAAALSAPAARRTTPILLDTDIGTDIDDAFALALVLDSPELDLRAVTTVSGDTMARARLAAKLLAVARRGAIPVAAGRAGAKRNEAQTRWADGFSSPSLVPESAVALMKSEIDRAHGRLVLVAIGPLTNIAELLREYPGEATEIREIVLMGGSIRRGYYPNSAATAEYNIAADIPASRTVFSAGIPILMAPLDVTARLQLEQPALGQVFGVHSALTDALQALYLLWGQPVPTLHDPMAVSLLLKPQLCTRQRLGIQITSTGMTVIGKGLPVNAVVGTKTDPARFIHFYTERVGR